MSSKVIILDKDIMVKPAGLTLITLMHPKRVPVLFVTIDNSLHELQEVNSRKFGSWFIDQRIASPGSYYMVNRIDPRYLCLPYLEKNGGNYSPLEQIIQNEDGCDRMPLNNHLDWKLGDMCDETDRLGDLLLYRFNKVKAMEWLKAKVQRTASVVAEQRQRNRRTSAMYSSNFNFSGQSTVTAQSSVSEANVERVDIVDSLQIICEYLSDAWVQLLTSEYNVTEEEIYPKISTKRKTDWESALEVEKVETAILLPVAEKSSSKAGVSTVAKSASMKKSKSALPPQKGTASISSFFAKK